MITNLTQKSDLLVSIVSPVYNARGYIRDYILEVSKVLSQGFKDYEIILVDNVSTDGTANEIEHLQKEVKNVQLYCLTRSIPYDSAFVVGLEQAIGDVVITLDPCYDPTDRINEAIELYHNGISIVYGLRKDRIAPKKRHLYQWLVLTFFKLYCRITQEKFPVAASTFRLFSRQSLNTFLDNRDRYSLFPVISAFAGLPFRTLTYNQINRNGEPISVNYEVAFRRALRILLLSSQQPLRLLTIVSLLGSFLSILYSIYVIIVNLVKGNVAEGWTSLSLVISSLFFLLFLILAILCEYVGRLFMHNQSRPFYLIAKESRSLVLSRKQELNVTSSRSEFNS